MKIVLKGIEIRMEEGGQEDENDFAYNEAAQTTIKNTDSSIVIRKPNPYIKHDQSAIGAIPNTSVEMYTRELLSSQKKRQLSKIIEISKDGVSER